MRSRIALLLGLLCVSVPAAAEQYTESNPIYDLELAYSTEGDRFQYTIDYENKLEIKVLFAGIDLNFTCQSGKIESRVIRPLDREVSAQSSKRFGGEQASLMACSPTTRWNAQAKRTEPVHDAIATVRPLRIGMYQHGTSPGQMDWDCEDETITVSAVKFPHGTSFRLIASNGRSMVSKPESFKREDAVAHLCGRTVSQPDRVSEGVHKLIEQWQSFCDRAPQLCDATYDHENKRAGGVRG